MLPLLLALVPIAFIPAPVSPVRPTIGYALRVDPAHAEFVDVALTVRDAPPRFDLAMRIHGEYNARYWRNIDSVRVEQSTSAAAASVVRADSTLWHVTLPGGGGVIRYRVRINPDSATSRNAWKPHVRANGAMINGPDVFLYLPEFASVPVTVSLDAPAEWRVATSLEAGGASRTYVAPNAAALLDSPLLMGAIREWTFDDRGTTFHVAYWPLPAATPFDTVAFVDGVRRLTRATMDVFGSAPSRQYYFLVQDGAFDALEHRASVAIGIRSANLARDPHASMMELAHEFVHTWNLVAIRPARYNDLSYRAPAHTDLLWLGEGVTIYYSDVLVRRAGLADPSVSRLDHLAGLLDRYYGSTAALRVSPARASLAFGDPPVANPDATGGYYLQGELLATEIDALMRDSTGGRRGLDDLLRALFVESATNAERGFTTADIRRVANAICGCRLDALFASQIAGAGPITVAPALARMGLRAIVDSIVSADSAGHPVTDMRLNVYAADEPGATLRLVLYNSSSEWARAGLETGDDIETINGAPTRTYADFRAALSRIRVGDSVVVQERRHGQPTSVAFVMSAFPRPRVRFEDLAVVTPEQRAARAAWMSAR